MAAALAAANPDDTQAVDALSSTGTRPALTAAPLAGGDRAAIEPWRNALVRLDQAGLSDWADRLFAEKPCAVLRPCSVSQMRPPGRSTRAASVTAWAGLAA